MLVDNQTKNEDFEAFFNALPEVVEAHAAVRKQREACVSLAVASVERWESLRESKATLVERAQEVDASAQKLSTLQAALRDQWLRSCSKDAIARRLREARESEHGRALEAQSRMVKAESGASAALFDEEAFDEFVRARTAAHRHELVLTALEADGNSGVGHSD